MCSLEFRDAWTEAGRGEPSSTNRSEMIINAFYFLKCILTNFSFSTHTDYIYTNIPAEEVIKISRVVHHPSEASDHKMVIATFNIK